MNRESHRAVLPPADVSIGLGSATAMNILIVDDHLETAETLAALFEGRGHRVVVAADPLDCLAGVADFEPDVAILDIGLPKMDGYELAEHLRVNGLRCRMIALSGASQRDWRRCTKAGIDVYLVKPVDYDVLVGAAENGGAAKAV